MKKTTKTIVDENGEKSFPLDGDDEGLVIYINPLFDEGDNHGYREMERKDDSNRGRISQR